MKALRYLSIAWSAVGALALVVGNDSRFPFLMGGIFLVGDFIVSAITRRGAA